METASLYSIAKVIRHLEKDSTANYFSLNNIRLKESEIAPLIALVDAIVKTNKALALNCLEHFLIGYSIPQIGKEFDLLCIGREGVVNVELKSTSTPLKRIEQLKKNLHYLQAVHPRVVLYSYDHAANSLCRLTVNESHATLTPVSCSDIIKALCFIMPYPMKKEHVDRLFAPSQYLVSPFNDTQSFLCGNYYFTHQQDEFKSSIIDAIKKGQPSYLGITGHAGTGKTLLLYDLVKTLTKDGQRVAIIHCGALNEGQERLNELGWTIFPAKDFFTSYTSAASVARDFDIIALDEAQRIYLYQFEHLIKWTKESKICCVFSFDDMQVLNPSEINNKMGNRIRELCKNNIWKLTNKIRTNPNIHGFIDALFFKRNHYHSIADNISVDYCGTIEELHLTLNHLQQRGFVIPVYTPGSRSNFYYQQWFSSIQSSYSAHSVIGQEFDKVAAVIGPNVNYNDDGKLRSIKGYYLEVGMLYQILTRTRESLYVIVYDNPQLFCRCVELLHLGS